MSKPTKYYLVSEKELMFLEKAKIENRYPAGAQVLSVVQVMLSTW